MKSLNIKVPPALSDCFDEIVRGPKAVNGRAVSALWSRPLDRTETISGLSHEAVRWLSRLGRTDAGKAPSDFKVQLERLEGRKVECGRGKYEKVKRHNDTGCCLPLRNKPCGFSEKNILPTASGQIKKLYRDLIESPSKKSKVANALTGFVRRECANWSRDHQHEGGCLGISIDGKSRFNAGSCLIMEGKPCAYFEAVVLGPAKYKYRSPDYDWEKLFALYGEINLSYQGKRVQVRKCDCGKTLKPRQRCCSKCARRNRQKTNRENQRRYYKKCRIAS